MERIHKANVVSPEVILMCVCLCVSVNHINQS